FDKVCLTLRFLQNLPLGKTQADTLLKQLSRHWEHEFDVLCTLLANSLVVHTDETSWSINSVWAFLSEKARVVLFGVHKDAATLEQFLDPQTFGGLVISDDAAVYENFSQAQKCWAHLLRKAIKLTLQEPANQEYRQFTDRLLEIYRAACRIQRDGRLSAAGRVARLLPTGSGQRTRCQHPRSAIATSNQLLSWAGEPGLENQKSEYRVVWHADLSHVCPSRQQTEPHGCIEQLRHCVLRQETAEQVTSQGRRSQSIPDYDLAGVSIRV